MQRPSSLTNSYHSSEEQILIFGELRKVIISLLNRYPISDTSYIKELYTQHGLIHLLAACKEVNRRNFVAVFSYVRLHEDLVARYYVSPTLGSRIFQKIFFNKILPDNLIFLFVLCRKVIVVNCKMVIEYLGKCKGE